jgi:hypothetical protein
MILMGGSKPFFNAAQNAAAFEESMLTRVLTYNYLAAYNHWLLWYPFQLVHDYGGGVMTLVTDTSDLRNLASVANYAVLIALSVYAIIPTFARMAKPAKPAKPTSKGNEMAQLSSVRSQAIVVMGLAMLVLPFIPASNMFMPVGFTLAERVLFLPSMGWAVLVTLLLARLRSLLPSSAKPAVFAVVLLTTCLFGAKTVSRSFDWQMNSRLYATCLDVFPDSPICNFNHGTVLSGDKSPEAQIKAQEHYKRTLKLNPSHFSATMNVANSLARTNREAEAEPYMRRAYALAPTNDKLLTNLAAVIKYGDIASGKPVSTS